MLALCLVLVPMLFAAESDADVANKTVGPTNAAPIQLQKSASPRRVPQSRDLLFSQIPSTTANAVACQLDLVYPFEADLVEDVTPTEDWMIDSVVGYVGVWGTWVGWSLVPNVRFLVYADSSIGNHPVDSPFVEIIIDQGTYETAVYGSGYIVGLPLPSPVNLTAGVTYWLEVQPCFSFAANGQVGTMTEVGIGNGQEFFNRFPLLGTIVFTTATTGGWAGQEGGIELYGTTGAAPATFWDFETGWQDWTHTNGQVFPAAWDVQASGIHTPCPDPGDSSMWIDSDASMGGYSDSALSPLLDPNPTMDWLKYGYYNYGGSGNYINELRVGIKYFTSGVWNVVELAYYPAGVTSGPAWDSVDVSAHATADLVQIYFYHDDLGTWGYYSAFDNVSIDATIYVADHDVGTMSIDAPGTTVFPNTTIDPSATYQNFGATAETFDVYFMIDSSGTIIYNETANITLDAGDDSTITFASWTCGPTDGIIYDITAYTYLVGDQDPSNDTLTIQTITTMIGAWTQCANMPTGECANATAYDPVNDRIYSFGGTMAGGAGDYQNWTYQYDPIGNVWNTMTNMPNACDWIAASYVNGKFYVIGGYNGTANNWNMIYDISGNVWATGAVITQARHSHSQVAYNDSLIYVLAGRDASGTPQSTVFIYNTYTDTWTTGTSMPTTCHKGGAAIIDSMIYLVGGWNAAGTALANLYVGVIDPANCENITWSTGSALPYANAAAGVIQGQRSSNWYIFMVGGFVNGSTVTDETWEYVVASDLWNQLPDYTPFTIARNNYAVYRDGYNELYVCGGGMSGGFSGSNQTWKLPWQTGVAEQPGDEIPMRLGFAPMVNPTRNHAVISYHITQPGMVSLKVYDRTGRLVETLVNNTQNAGTQTVTWDARKMSNGVYFLRLQADNQTAVHKLILVK